MRIIPAIDLLGGVCVRLRQGDYAQSTVYGDDPLAVARGFAADGARLIHLVDLDGAKAGRSLQAEMVRRVAAAVPVPVEVGGGIRTLAEISSYLEGGVARVILGSVAVKDPPLLGEAVARYGHRVVVGIDARDGLVAVSGWTEASVRDPLDLAVEMAGIGLRELIYTDIARDGMLGGPDLAGLRRMVSGSGLLVVASGGISSHADLEAVAAAGADGAIVGKALYDGRIDLRRAVLDFEGPRPASP